MERMCVCMCVCVCVCVCVCDAGVGVCYVGGWVGGCKCCTVVALNVQSQFKRPHTADDKIRSIFNSHLN